jgi:hypothetical protein
MSKDEHLRAKREALMTENCVLVDILRSQLVDLRDHLAEARRTAQEARTLLVDEKTSDRIRLPPQRNSN